MILSPAGRRFRIGLAALLASAIFCLIFWGLFQIDWPFVRFLRSLHVGWLERLGDVGTRLGSGAALVAVSVGLLLAGWRWKRPALQQAGFKSLLAHGIAAIVVQALKHGIARPRPRWMHADGGFSWGPSLGSGLDSFPSGHTAASFAVATALAKSFPRFAWFLYGTAGFIAASRAVRGSHFPTDVIAGLCLGTIVGASCVYPFGQWKRALSELVLQLLPVLVLVFSVLWLMTHFQRPLMADAMMLAGQVVLIIGAGMRMYRTMRPAQAIVVRELPLGNSLIVLGLALTTGSWLITVLVAMLCVVHWSMHHEACQVRGQETAPAWSYRAALAEIPLLFAIALAVLTIRSLKGLLPLV